LLGDEKSDRFVSKMLRGKHWEYFFDRSQGASPQMLPQQLSIASLEGQFVAGKSAKFEVYPARMSPLEIIAFEKTLRMNRNAGDKLAELKMQLEEALSKPTIVDLPALFDIPEGGMTETFHPNLVNSLVVGSHIMMPRPFGPRMKAADAIAVLTNVVDESMLGNLTAAFVKKMKLEEQVINIRNYPESEYSQKLSVGHIHNLFVDVPSDFDERLIQANRTAFTADRPNPDLKEGWQKLTIPEKTVDLFEFYTLIALAPLGLTVHWIDTWYYHVRHGGLHCGTNAIRTP
jgi:hypothetical protein